MSELDECVAIVTGSSRSIGAEIARRLSHNGASVVVNYHNDEENANTVVDEFVDAGGEAIAVQADVSDTDDIAELFDTTLDHFGHVDIVVTNAGIQPPTSPIEEVTEEEFDRVFGLNTRGYSSSFGRLPADSTMVAESSISPPAGRCPRAGLSVYGGSKTTPKFFAEVLAKELGDHEITVNSVVSGAIDAGSLDDTDEQFKQELAASSPFDRLGTTDDIADVVAFLASDDARWITGEEILVNASADV